MSDQALKWVRTQMPRARNGGPDPQGKSILMTLAMMHNKRDDIDLFPGHKYISEQTGLSTSTVGDRLKSLAVQGYLKRETRFRRSGDRRGQRTTDLYELNLNRPPDDLTQRRPQPKNLAASNGKRKAATNKDHGLNYEHFDTEPLFPAERSHRGVSTWSVLELATEAVDLLNWVGYPKPPSPKTLMPVIQDLDARYGRHQTMQRAGLRQALLNKTQVEAFLRRGMTAEQVVLQVLITVAVNEREIQPLSAGEASVGQGQYRSVDGSLHQSEHHCRMNDLAVENERYETDMTQHISTPGQSPTPQPAPDPGLAKAVARQKSAQRTTRTPSDEEILAWYRTFAADNPRRAPLTPRQREQYLRDRADIEKPRDEWKLMDVARYFATSIQVRKPHLIGRPNVKQLHGALAAWQLDHRVEQDEIVRIMDKYLNDTKAMSRLDRDPKPIEHFLQYLKQQPRAEKVDEEWLKKMHQETEAIWGSA